MSLLLLLGAVLVLCIVFWAANALLTAFGVSDPLRTVVLVVIVLIALVWFLSVLGVPGLRLR